ncbi:hypothetical protein D3OALGA1CA_5279 [Olavius algarvensis associated proteobacterium Delta 3]|nr:hypothetical protein D3OALGB2SA_5003 [Olavius algarvensis associated proteobacterium Delta 3]CAB5164446.1 hypothetical protein D3OALGA1CA_5279 [Olavius algarvensis associated proteobacterium Delta 3]
MHRDPRTKKGAPRIEFFNPGFFVCKGCNFRHTAEAAFSKEQDA